MFISDISVKRPVMMSMILLVCVLFGVLGYNNLSVSLLPDFKIPIVTVQTIYPGASPVEIENQITKKIEDEVAGLSLLDQMVSYSMDNVSMIMITFDLEKDENIALQEVKDKVDQILNDLPAAADRPVVKNYDVGSDPIMNIVMQGNLPATELYDLASNSVKNRISQIQGVGAVNIIGGQEREIRVELDNRIIYENMVAPTDVAGLIAASNLDMPAGNYKSGDQEYSVRLKGKVSALDTLRQLDVPTAVGVKKLWQLGEVKDTYKEVRQRVSFLDNRIKEKDENAILITVLKTSVGNTVDTVDAVTAILPELESDLGSDVKLTVVSESGTHVKDVVNDSFSNIIQGVLLTALVLLLFLHNFRSTIIVGIAIPISIVSAFMVMNMMGLTLNLMTLIALASSSGSLITGAVVVLENIFRHREMGKDRKTAALEGTSEVTTAVIASILTNIVVFMPIVNMSGITGVALREFALTVVIATSFSLVASFTVTPMLAAIILPEGAMKEHRFGVYFERIFNGIAEKYSKLLNGILKSRSRSMMVVALTVALLGVAVWILSAIPTDFIPSMDNGKIQIQVELPAGYQLEETADLLEEIENRVKVHPEVNTVLTTLGKISDLNEGTNVALMKLELPPKQERKRSDKQLVAQITKELSDIPNAEIRVSSSTGSSVINNKLEFYLQGQDMDQLQQYAADLKSKMQQISGLMNVTNSIQAGKSELVMIPDRVKINEVGITAQQLALMMRLAVEGIEVTEYEEAGNKYDIRVVLNETGMGSYEEFKNLPIATKIGIIPLSQLGQLDFVDSYNKILHADKYVAIEFAADIMPGTAMGEMTDAVEAVVETLNLPTGYQIKWSGISNQMFEMVKGIVFAFILAVVLTYMLLAATLENFIQPLLILTTVPLCIIGVAFALLITNNTLSLVVLVSVVMLVGVVVNNAILILDYANQLQAEGKSLREALVEACSVKLKAIVMSNLASVFGMLTMALGIGPMGAEVRQPLGIATIWGILSSTVLTILFIPAAQVLLASKKKQSLKNQTTARKADI